MATTSKDNRFMGDDEEARALTIIKRGGDADDQPGEGEEPETEQELSDEEAEDKFLKWSDDMDAADAEKSKREDALGALASHGVDLTRPLTRDSDEPAHERSTAYLHSYVQAKYDSGEWRRRVDDGDIRMENGKHCAYSKDGDKLGEFDTHDEAAARIAQFKTDAEQERDEIGRFGAGGGGGSKAPKEKWESEHDAEKASRAKPGKADHPGLSGSNGDHTAKTNEKGGVMHHGVVTEIGPTGHVVTTHEGAKHYGGLSPDAKIGDRVTQRSSASNSKSSVVTNHSQNLREGKPATPANEQRMIDRHAKSAALSRELGKKPSKKKDSFYEEGESDGDEELQYEDDGEEEGMSDEEAEASFEDWSSQRDGENRGKLLAGVAAYGVDVTEPPSSDRDGPPIQDRSEAYLQAYLGALDGYEAASRQDAGDWERDEAGKFSGPGGGGGGGASTKESHGQTARDHAKAAGAHAAKLRKENHPDAHHAAKAAKSARSAARAAEKAATPEEAAKHAAKAKGHSEKASSHGAAPKGGGTFKPKGLEHLTDKEMDKQVKLREKSATESASHAAKASEKAKDEKSHEKARGEHVMAGTAHQSLAGVLPEGAAKEAALKQAAHHEQKAKEHEHEAKSAGAPKAAAAIKAAQEEPGYDEHQATKHMSREELQQHEADKAKQASFSKQGAALQSGGLDKPDKGGGKPTTLAGKAFDHGVSFEEIKNIEAGKPASFETIKKLSGKLTDGEMHTLVHGKSAGPLPKGLSKANLAELAKYPAGKPKK